MKEYSYGVCPYRIKKGKVQILLIQPKGHTEWGFIKGKINIGESISECAKRETLEETNINININNLEDYFYQKNKRKDVGIFLINTKTLNLKNIKLKKNEVHRINFFDLESDICINKNQSEILQNIRKKFILEESPSKINLCSSYNQ